MKKYLLLLPALLGAYFLFSGQSNPERNDDIPEPERKTNGKRIYEMRGGGGIVAVNPSFKVFESPNRQFKSTESFTHPTNPNIFFTASVTNLGIGAYATTNGGYTWNGSDTLTGQSGFGGYFKPWITNSGVFYLGLARDLLRSTNNGATWTYAGSPPQLGHSAFGIDNNPSSPYFGRMYHVGQNAQGDAYGSYSTNDGVTWSTPDTIKTYSGVNFLYFEGFDLDIANDGRVYASYSTVNYDTPMEGPSFIVEISTSVSMSSNGGVDWTEPVGIGVSGVGRKNFLGGTIYKLNSYSKIAVDKSGGSRNGWIYVTETNRLGLAQDSADIILRRSTNNGATFPFSIRVNQDTPGNKKYQYMPAIKVDSYGGINIIYYDSREASQEDSVKVYMSRSVDGGNTWTDFPISERIFKPQQSATEIHSLGITESNNKIWPTWYSVESGVEQVWTAPVEIGPVIVHSKLGDNENLNGPYIVNAEILPNGSSIVGSETKVFWSRDGGPLTNSVTMSNSGGNNWSANIPGNGSQAEYRYYIITQDALGRASSSPFGAPAAFNTFHSAPDNSDPVIGYTPVSNRVSLQSLPFSIDAKINDNAYIDSAYVKWYKNDNPVPNNLLLNNIEHDRYIGQVDPGHVGLSDSIRFRIYAVDNSGAGNVDSTELYTLKFYDVPFVETFPLAGTNGEAWNSSRWTGGGTVIHRIYNNLSFRFPSEPALGYSGSPATLKPLDLSGVPGSKLSLLFHVGWDHNSGVDSLIITYKDTNNVFKYLTGIQGPFNVFNPYPALEVEFPPDVNLSSFQFRLNSTGGMFFDNIQVIRQINNDNIVLGDNFTIPFLNQGNWNPGNSSFRVIDKDSTIGGTFPYEVPSAPYFLSVRGDGILESKTRDLSGFSSATIFMKHSEHDLETDEKVYLEYFDGTRAWQQLIAFTGTDNNSFVPFSDKALVLPANALHSDFKLRFRSEGLESDDEWLFDNIFINQGIFTGNEISGNSIPQIFELHQNFPNPFNPITRIKFDIPKHSFVKLKIFDILGREVANLVSSEYFPGSYSVDFNASKFSSGAYFYRLEAGDFVQTKKMLLLK